VLILHSGVLEDGRLAKQTAGSFRRVAAGKVAGVQALERQLSNAPTQGIVAFSSVSSIVAPLGQPNYASANASLCAWASTKAAQGREDAHQLPCRSDARFLSKTVTQGKSLMY
jgi:KR domain